ncbi:hypothetical protein OIU78_012471, partial [Salix suchowensis]
MTLIHTLILLFCSTTASIRTTQGKNRTLRTRSCFFFYFKHFKPNSK